MSWDLGSSLRCAIVAGETGGAWFAAKMACRSSGVPSRSSKGPGSTPRRGIVGPGPFRLDGSELPISPEFARFRDDPTATPLLRVGRDETGPSVKGGQSHGERSDGAAFRHLRDLFGAGSVVGLGDGQLLARYSSSKDEAAFEALVGRHGPMVLATCRAVLRNEHDVEDAFQATFLVLARKAGSIRGGDALGGWLHRVAYRASVQASVEAKRRRRKRGGGIGDGPPGRDPVPVSRPNSTRRSCTRRSTACPRPIASRSCSATWRG